MVNTILAMRLWIPHSSDLIAFKSFCKCLLQKMPCPPLYIRDTRGIPCIQLYKIVRNLAFRSGMEYNAFPKKKDKDSSLLILDEDQVKSYTHMKNNLQHVIVLSQKKGIQCRQPHCDQIEHDNMFWSCDTAVCPILAFIYWILK